MHEHVESAEFRFRFAYAARGLTRDGVIGLDRHRFAAGRANRGERRIRRRTVAAVGEGDAVAGARQIERDPLGESARRPGDEGGATLCAQTLTG
jgi:hypothetical protein